MTRSLSPPADWKGQSSRGRLRDLGFTETLFYKEDAATAAGAYSDGKGPASPYRAGKYSLDLVVLRAPYLFEDGQHVRMTAEKLVRTDHVDYGLLLEDEL